MKRSPMKRGKPLKRRRGMVAKFLRGEIGLETPKVEKAVRKAMQRTAWKRRRTARATLKAAMLKAALNLYFYAEDPWEPAKCQACGKPLRQADADPHHKKRSSARGVDSPANLLAVHRKCHDWIHLGGSRGPAETAARTSPANMTNGDTVAWPPELKAKLTDYLNGGTPAWKR